MFKMKEVCQMTGLTEKAIRVYMEQKLVEPKVEEGPHRKSYYFEEKDIERLRDIAALRSAGFSLADIKLMIEDPVNISALVEEREALITMELSQKKNVQEALRHLSIEEYNSVTKLADAIEPRSTFAKETKKSRLPRWAKLSIAVCVCLLLMIVPTLLNGEFMVEPYIMSFGLVFGAIAIIMGLRYLLYGRKSKKFSNKGTGKIVAVVTNDNIEAYFGEEDISTAKEIGKYLTVGLLGEIWKRLRLDCWHPLIEYQGTDGEKCIATVKHGAYKRSWTVDDEVEIIWEDGKENLVYLCDNSVLYKKALGYLLPGLIAFVIAIFMWGNVLEQTGLLERLQPVSEEPRELTTEEINEIMQTVEELSIVDEKRVSFDASDLSEIEVTNFCYRIHYETTGEYIYGMATLHDMAESYFDRKVSEDDIICECGEVLAFYDGPSMRFTHNEGHAHEDAFELEVENRYVDSYFDGEYFTITVEKMYEGDNETETCTYVFKKYNKGGFSVSSYTFIRCEFM